MKYEFLLTFLRELLVSLRNLYNLWLLLVDSNVRAPCSVSFSCLSNDQDPFSDPCDTSSDKSPRTHPIDGSILRWSCSSSGEIQIMPIVITIEQRCWNFVHFFIAESTDLSIQSDQSKTRYKTSLLHVQQCAFCCSSRLAPCPTRASFWREEMRVGGNAGGRKGGRV